VNGRRIVAVQQHIPTPVTHAYDEQLDLEIAGRFSLREHLKDPLLRILVFHRRALRTFGPAEHVFHRHPSFALKSSERMFSDRGSSLARADFVDKSAFGRHKIGNRRLS
jgi:hypothetical protein